VGQDRLGRLETDVLSVILRLRGDAYGVTIQREIARETGRELSFGTIYTTLERLQGKGFVTSRLGEATAERGGRAKKFFDITGAGQKALHDSERAMAELRGNFGVAGA
jgi:PadR family transcriptional regulator, regulatory protein PadR